MIMASDAPSKVFFAITNICNAKCITCDIGLEKRGVRLADSVFLRNLNSTKQEYSSEELLDRLRGDLDDPSPDIYVTGGEPLISPKFLGFLKRFSGYRGKISLVTNGHFLSRYVEQLVPSVISSINVSMDGMRRTHDEVRGVKGMYDRIADGLATLIDRRRQTCSVQEICVNFTISSRTYREIYEFSRAMGNTGIDRIDFLHPQYIDASMASSHNALHPDLPVGTRMHPSDASLYRIPSEELLVLMSQTSADFGTKVAFFPKLEGDQLRTYYERPLEFPWLTTCSAPWTELQVIQNGDCLIASPCVPYVIGNLLSSSVTEIWSGERLRRFRQRLKEVERFPICAKCCHYYYSPRSSSHELQ